MANFTLSNANAKEAWSTKYASEYVAKSGLLPFMSASDNAIIRVNTDLGKAGDTVNLTYFGKLKGAGKSGGETLKGSAEALRNYSTSIKVKHVRNAVNIPEHESFRTEIDIANKARGGLKDWSAEKLRDDLLARMQDVVIDGGLDADGTPEADSYKTLAASSAGERNAYLVANDDRILFAGAQSPVDGDFNASLATVGAGDVLTADIVSTAKDLAETSADFRITPYMDKAGNKWFVMFVCSEGYRQLRNDDRIDAANKDARPREVEDNPLFTGGDMLWDGVIIKKITEIPVVSATQRFAGLMGANALGVAFSRKPSFRVQEEDFGHEYGVAITEIRGQSKMSAAGVQTGMVSIYHGLAA